MYLLDRRQPDLRLLSSSPPPRLFYEDMWTPHTGVKERHLDCYFSVLRSFRGGRLTR